MLKVKYCNRISHPVSIDEDAAHRPCCSCGAELASSLEVDAAMWRAAAPAAAGATPVPAPAQRRAEVDGAGLANSKVPRQLVSAVGRATCNSSCCQEAQEPIVQAVAQGGCSWYPSARLMQKTHSLTDVI